MVDKENNNDEINNGSLTFFANKKVPEAAMPNKAMLITMNAKW